MQNFRSFGLKTKKFIITGILEITVQSWPFSPPENVAGFRNTRNNKLFCFQPEWPEILHVVIIQNLSIFVFYKILCAEKVLLMKLFQFWSRNRFLKIHWSDNGVAPHHLPITPTFEVQAFQWWQKKFISGKHKYLNWAI